MTNKASHNFLENIGQLSEAKELNDLKNEWKFIDYNKCISKTTLCICNRKIMNVHRYINIKTGCMITVGSDCAKKLNLTNSRNWLKREIDNYMSGEPGDYKIITDLIKFSEGVRASFIEMLEEKLKKQPGNKNLKTLIDLLKNIIIHTADLNNALTQIEIYIKEYQKDLESKRLYAIQCRHREMEFESKRLYAMYAENARQERIRLENKKREKEGNLRQETIRLENKKREKEEKHAKKLEEALELSLKSQKEGLFKKITMELGGKSAFRKKIRDEVGKCENCELINWCSICTTKITALVNDHINGLVEIEMNKRYPN